MRSESVDWSPVGFTQDPTPGDPETIDVLQVEVVTEAERLAYQAQTVAKVAETLPDARWTGKAADAYAQRLREVVEAAMAASARHQHAADALRTWSFRLSCAQEAADAALRAAQEAEEDIALAEASIGLLTSEHAALLATLRAMEKSLASNGGDPRPGTNRTSGTDVSGARRRLGDAETELAAARSRLDDAEHRLMLARSAACEAAEEFDAGETSFVRALEETLVGAVVSFSGLNAIGGSGPAPSRTAQGPIARDLRGIRDLINEANDTVWEMTRAWALGDGPRHFTFGEHDAFTKVFRQSASVEEAMKTLADHIKRNGQSVGDGNWDDDGLRYDAKASDLPRDAGTVGSLGREGNLPESFIGSFRFFYVIVGTDPAGNLLVRVRVENHTTLESGTRIPGSGDWLGGPYYLPPYQRLKELQGSGRFPDISQEITWVEVISPR